MTTDNKIGKRYGMLVVLSEAPPHIRPDGRKDKMYYCQCDCGNIAYKRSYTLKDEDRMVNCGCFNGRGNKGKTWRKGDPSSKRRLYYVWAGMKNRCYNSNEPMYRNYGGRGISVCDEWKNDYAAFETWALLNGYQDDLTIDRIDVNGDYEPSNCRWATPRQQSNNRRNTNYMTLNGVTKSRADWARETGISLWTLRVRVEKLGWSDEKALTTPLNATRYGKKPANTIYEDENGFIPSTYYMLEFLYDAYKNDNSMLFTKKSLSEELQLSQNQITRNCKILSDIEIIELDHKTIRTKDGHPYNLFGYRLTDNKELQDKYRILLDEHNKQLAESEESLVANKA